MAILYYVPIMDSIEDYGSLQNAFKDAFVKEYGETAFVELQHQVCDYWTTVQKRIENAIPDVRGFRIYHDGFPVGSREKVLALFGYVFRDNPKSPSLQLVKKLLDKGAVLEGTEDIALVAEQVRIYECVAHASKEEQQRIAAVHADRAKELVELRDDFIAQRICDTLSEDSYGILFMDSGHDVIRILEMLPRSITFVRM